MVKLCIEDLRQFWGEAFRNVKVTDIDGLETVVLLFLGDEDLFTELSNVFEVADTEVELGLLQILNLLERLLQVFLKLLVLFFELFIV